MSISRRFGACIALGMICAAATGVRAAEPLAPLLLGEIKPEGWLRATMERDLKSGFQGHLDELLQDLKTKEHPLRPENNDFVTRKLNQDCRRDEHGRTIPPGHQTWWHGEMIGDWHDGLIRAAFLTGDAASKDKAGRFVDAILKSQDGDGYIGIYPRGFRYHFSITDGELWTQRCVMLGLLAYSEFTGREDVMAAVEKAVKLTIAQYGPGKNYFDNPGQRGSGVSHGLMFEDVLDWLYRLTRDESYKRAALKLYEDYSTSTNVQDKAGQLAHLLDAQSPLGGHGPDIMGFLRIPLLCYELSGKDDFRRAWENSILKAQRHLGVGGSPLSGQGEQIIETGQTPGLPYEYCSTFYLLHSLTWAIAKTGEACLGDMFERTLFNAAMGARFADGKALTYYSADERLWVRQKPPEGAGNRRYIYTAAYYPSCCHNSGARVFPYTVPAMWMRSRGKAGEGLAATIYGPCHIDTKINGVPVKIAERTGYPFDFNLEFAIEPEAEVSFDLRLRVPEWSGEPSIAAPGAEVSREAGFLVVSKKWKKGDSLRLTLKPSIQGRKAINGTTAVAYGPLVFSLPISETAEIVQRFPEAEAAGLKGFFGYQYDPANLAEAKRPLKLASGKADFGFSVIGDKKADPLHPWDHSPLKLRGELIGAQGKPESVELLPMGSTLLRRTCFESE